MISSKEQHRISTVSVEIMDCKVISFMTCYNILNIMPLTLTLLTLGVGVRMKLKRLQRNHDEDISDMKRLLKHGNSSGWC